MDALGNNDFVADSGKNELAHSVVLRKACDRQGHGQSAEEAVDAIGPQGSLDAAPVEGACGLDARHLGSGRHVSDDLHAQHYETHQVG